MPKHRPTEPGALFRLEFAVIGTWIAVFMACALAPFTYAAVPESGVALLATAALFSLVGLMLKSGAAPRTSFWTLCSVAAVLFVVMPYFEGGPDASMICWCAILPLATTLFDGARAGFIGLTLGLVTAGLMLVSAHLSAPEVVPSTMVSAVRGIGLVVCAFSFALMSERMRSAALVRAQEATRARTYFLASMSHEFRTPMNGVIGVAEAMIERPRSVEDHEALQLIKRSGQQLLALIGDTLDFASLEAGRLKVTPVPTAIETLSHDVLDLTSAAIRKEGVRLDIDIAPHVPRWLELDGLRVRQVLTNLVYNALKFTSAGEVRVLVTTVRQELAIDVVDTGVGIPADQVERIFEPFEQLPGSSRYLGHGLGLAITRQLVELMHGSITMTSEVGRGTRVSVRLPLIPTAPPAPTVRSSPLNVAPAVTGPARVLIVDDNEINLRVAAALVRRAGFEVELVRSGAEAVRAVSEKPYVLVLMDCYMPEMDGFEATKKIRALPGAVARVPIVAVTASALPEDFERCRTVGMNACMTKPLTLDELERAFGLALTA